MSDLSTNPDQRHSSQATPEEKVGMIYVYKEEETGLTKSCMVGTPVTQEVYDLMPEYVRENFYRPDDRENEVIKAREEWA